MTGATIFVVGMVVLLVAYGIAFWLIVAKDRDIFRPSRQPSEFELAAKRLSASMVQVQIAFADAMTPALKHAAESIARFHAAMTKDDSNTGDRHD